MNSQEEANNITTTTTTAEQLVMGIGNDIDKDRTPRPTLVPAEVEEKQEQEVVVATEEVVIEVAATTADMVATPDGGEDDEIAVTAAPATSAEAGIVELEATQYTNSSQDAGAAGTKDTTTCKSTKERDDSVMWISAHEKDMQKRMNYLFNRLNQGLTTKLHAYGMAIGTAVWMGCSMRNQFKGVQQAARILELKDTESKRESFGMEITLSRAANSNMEQEGGSCGPLVSKNAFDRHRPTYLRVGSSRQADGGQHQSGYTWVKKQRSSGSSTAGEDNKTAAVSSKSSETAEKDDSAATETVKKERRTEASRKQQRQSTRSVKREKKVADAGAQTSTTTDADDDVLPVQETTTKATTRAVIDTSAKRQQLKSTADVKVLSEKVIDMTTTEVDNVATAAEKENSTGNRQQPNRPFKDSSSGKAHAKDERTSPRTAEQQRPATDEVVGKKPRYSKQHQQHHEGKFYDDSSMGGQDQRRVRPDYNQHQSRRGGNPSGYLGAHHRNSFYEQQQQQQRPSNNGFYQQRDGGYQAPYYKGDQGGYWGDRSRFYLKPYTQHHHQQQQSRGGLEFTNDHMQQQQKQHHQYQKQQQPQFGGFQGSTSHGGPSKYMSSMSSEMQDSRQLKRWVSQTIDE